jgi:hypothetical protein
MTGRTIYATCPCPLCGGHLEPVGTIGYLAWSRCCDCGREWSWDQRLVEAEPAEPAETDEPAEAEADDDEEGDIVTKPSYSDYYRMTPAEQPITLGVRLYDRMTPAKVAAISESLRPKSEKAPPEPPSPGGSAGDPKPRRRKRR